MRSPAMAEQRSVACNHVLVAAVARPQALPPRRRMVQQIPRRRAVWRDPFDQHMQRAAAAQADIDPRAAHAIMQPLRLAVGQHFGGMARDIAFDAIAGEIAAGCNAIWLPSNSICAPGPRGALPSTLNRVASTAGRPASSAAASAGRISSLQPNVGQSAPSIEVSRHCSAAGRAGNEIEDCRALRRIGNRDHHPRARHRAARRGKHSDRDWRGSR